MRSNWTFSLLISLYCCGTIWTVDYEIVGDHDRFIEPCSKEDDKGNMEIGHFFDMSGIKRIYTDDLDFVYLTGDVVVKNTLPQGYPIKVATEVLYRSGNHWTKTVFSIRRNDMCVDLFNPSEFWYEFMNKLSEEQRVCPPKKGIAKFKDDLGIISLDWPENSINFNPIANIWALMRAKINKLKPKTLIELKKIIEKV